MRICYDYQIFAAQKYGGISRYFVEIASRISKFDHAEVRVVAPLYRSRFLEEKRNIIPISGIYFSKNFPRATGFCMAVDRALSAVPARSSAPEIVHETYYSRDATVRRARKRILTVHDTVAELFPDPPSMPCGPSPVRKAALDRADHLICISGNTRADLIRLYNVDPAKVSVIPLASSIVPSRNPPIASEEPFFLYVGGRWGYKNFLGFAKAFRESNLYRSHRVVCFGGDKFAPRELQRLKELELPLDRFGLVDGEDDLLARYYASAVALVYPSLYEGFGIPILEAMACGCPVLCGKTSSIPEVAGEAAMFFDDPSDSSAIGAAMLKISNSPDERNALIAKGNERVKQFSWDRCAQQTYAIYEKVLSGR